MSRDINSKLGNAREGIFQLHYEDTDVFEKIFRLETLTVIEAFKSIGNSFLETESYLIHITRKHNIKKNNLPLLFKKNSIASSNSKQ